MDVRAATFSQRELCQITGLDTVTVDTWLIRGILETTKVDGRVLRGRRLFSVLAIFEAKVTADLVSGLAMPPSEASKVARCAASPACSYWWRGSTRGGSRFRLMQTKTDRRGSSPCRSMKSGWQDPLLFCPPQICFRSSTKSASKLGVAQTTPDRAKSRNAGAFSRVTTWESSAARVGP
jgi:hypothetical protein